MSFDDAIENLEMDDHRKNDSLCAIMHPFLYMAYKHEAPKDYLSLEEQQLAACAAGDFMQMLNEMAGSEKGIDFDEIMRLCRLSIGAAMVAAKLHVRATNG